MSVRFSRTAWACKHGRNGRVPHHPGKRDLCHGKACLFAECLKLMQLLCFSRADGTADCSGSRVCQRMAGEISAAERTEYKHAHAQFLQCGNHFQLRIAANEAKAVFVRDQSQNAPLLGFCLRCHQVVRRECARGDVVDLALVLRCREGRPKLCPSGRCGQRGASYRSRHDPFAAFSGNDPNCGGSSRRKGRFRNLRRQAHRQEN